MVKKSLTSICIFKWVLKFDSSVRKMASESSNTSGTEETPFLDSATQRYCLIALMNISCVLKTGPAFCSTERSSCRDTILERSSWDLEKNPTLNRFVLYFWIHTRSHHHSFSSMSRRNNCYFNSLQCGGQQGWKSVCKWLWTTSTILI